MAGAAVLSTGFFPNDSDSCRREVLAFLRILAWPISAVEVNLWTSDGLPHGFRKWEVAKIDLYDLAREIAQFITESDVRTTATVLARRLAI